MNDMIESSQLTEQLQDQFSAVQKELPGAHESWIRVLRKSAMDQVVNQGMPTTRHEAWKYTDVRKYLDRLVAESVGGSGEVSREALSGFSFGDLDCHQIVIVDGELSLELSSLKDIPAGLRVESMASMLAKDPDGIEPYLHDQHLSGAFTALNSAMMSDGVYLDIPDGIVIEKPLHPALSFDCGR